jgi:hypothetical protein
LRLDLARLVRDVARVDLHHQWHEPIGIGALEHGAAIARGADREVAVQLARTLVDVVNRGSRVTISKAAFVDAGAPPQSSRSYGDRGGNAPHFFKKTQFK